MRRFKAGIIGAGVISRTYANDIQSFYKALEIEACADINTDCAKRLAAEFAIHKAYSVDELLNDKAIEIVINLTPPQSHMAVSRNIIAAGKHLFSEKPFAPTLREAEELLALAKANGVKVGC